MKYPFFARKRNLYLLFFIINYTLCLNAQINPSNNKIDWQLNVYLSPMLTQINNNTYSDEIKGKPGFNGGAGISYYFKNSLRLKLSTSLGLGYSYNSSNFNILYNDSIWTKDVNNDTVHIIEHGNVNEIQKASYLQLPLQFYVDYLLTDKWSLYFNTGFYLSFPVSGNYSTNATMSRQGYYPRFNTILYDIDIDGSKYYYPTNKKISGNGKLKLKTDVGLIFGLGAKFKYNQKFSFYAGLKTFAGLNNISGYNSDSTSLLNDDHSINSLMSKGRKTNISSFSIEFGMSMAIDWRELFKN